MTAQNDQTLGQIGVQIDTVTSEPRQQKSTNQDAHITQRAIHPTTVGIVSVATNTYTVTATADWEILWIHCDYTSSADVGNRHLRVALLTSGDTEIANFQTGQNQAASLVRHYVYIRGSSRESAFVNNEVYCSIPLGFVIPSGYKLKIYDGVGVSATDTMEITYQYVS